MTPEIVVMALTTNWCAANSISVMTIAMTALKPVTSLMSAFASPMLSLLDRGSRGLRDLVGLFGHEHAEVDEVPAHLARDHVDRGGVAALDGGNDAVAEVGPELVVPALDLGAELRPFLRRS